MNRLLVISLLFVGWLAFGCSTRPQSNESVVARPDTTENGADIASADEAATIGRALVAADETLKPIIEAEIAVFEGLFPEADIVVRYYPGERAIREMLTNDSVRLAISSRELTEEETAVLMRRKINPTYADVMKDGIILLVNEKNPVRQLSTEQMRDVLSGRIKSWYEIDPNAPEGEIVAVFEHAETSTIRYLQDSIMQGRPLLSNRYAQNPIDQLFSYVRSQERALGIVGFGWVSDQDDPEMQALLSGTEILELERPSGEDVPCVYEGKRFFGPWQAFLDQECYPLTRTIKTILREERHLVGTGFVSFLDGPRGQRVIHKAGLAATHTIPRRVAFPPLEDAQEIRETR